MAVVVGGSALAGLRVGDAAASALRVGDELAWSEGGGGAEPFSHETLAEYTIAELQEVGADLTANGTSSAFYPRFHSFLGQTKDFGTRTGSYAGTGDDAKVIAQLVGICHDDLADGSGKAGLTFLCNRSLAYAYQMNGSNTNSGGWSSSKMRTTLNSGEVYQSLPSDLRDAAVAVLKQTNNTGQASSASAVTTTSDRFWLASFVELYGTRGASDWPSGGKNNAVYFAEGEQFEHFANSGASVSAYAALADRNKTNTGGTILDREGSRRSDYSWLRSPYANFTNYFLYVAASGNWNGNYAAYGHGVCLGFCL